MARQTLANAETGLSVRDKLNAMSLELYGSWRAHVSGRKYHILPNVTIVAGSASGANTIRFTPFFVLQAVTIDILYANVSTLSAASNVQLAIYASDPTTMRPTGNPVARTGNISSAAAGEVSGAITQGTADLQPGLYWAAANMSDNTVALSSVPNSVTLSSWFLGTTGTLWASATAVGQIITFAQAFGSWPDMTSNTPTVTNGAVNSIPLLGYKVA